MKYYCFFVLITLYFGGFAPLAMSQNIDKNRMERDIEVAENVLESLWKQAREKEGEFMVLSSSQPKFNGVYVEDYGVVFSGTYSNFGLFDYRGKAYIAPQPPMRYYSWEGQRRDRRDDDDEEVDNVEESEFDEDNWDDNMSEHFYAVATEFLADYSTLISQLRSGEKITLRLGNKTNMPLVVFDGELPWSKRKMRSYSATATKENMEAYRNQRISRDEFIERIEFSSDEEVEEKEPELELLSSLLQRLYKEDLSSSFRLRRKPHYERLKDFGVIYHLDFSESGLAAVVWSKADGNVTIGKGANKKPEEMVERYERLSLDLPEQMVEYGRLLKNLAKGEKLVFKAVLPQCDDCGIPKAIELTVPQEVLRDYNTNKLNLTEAVNRVTINKK